MNRSDLKYAKTVIRSFMRESYSDDNLVKLLDHARSGKLAFMSCCCFAGLIHAQHADGQLRGIGMLDTNRHSKAYSIKASIAFNALGYKEEDGDGQGQISDFRRRRVIIPMVLAEIRRRYRIANSQTKETVHEYTTQGQ